MLLCFPELTVPILIPFSVYGEHMLENNSLMVSALATDQKNPKNVYLTEMKIIPKDPALTITVGLPPPVCLTACLSICLHACLSVCVPVCMSAHPSDCIVCLSVYVYVCVYVLRITLLTLCVCVL